MTARAIFKAHLGVGPLTVPVKFYTAVDDRGVHFRLLHESDQQPVTQELIDKVNDEPVSKDEVQKAYQLEDGRLVRLLPSELQALEPEDSRTVTISRFVAPALIPRPFYDRPYYLGPDGDSEAYLALGRALAERKLEGLAHWVMRKRTYVGVLQQRAGYLVMVTLRHAEEILDVGSFARPERKELSKQELDLARQLIGALAGRFEPELFPDDYRAGVEALVRSKASGQVIALPAAKRKPAPADLGAALERSLKAVKRHSA